MGTHSEKKSIFSRYGLAVLAALVAVGFKLAINPVIPRGMPIFVLVPLISAYWGGFGPGMLAAGLCSLANLYFFYPTSNSFALNSIPAVAQFVVFSGMSFFVSTLTSSLCSATEKTLKASERAMLYANQKASFVANVSHEVRTPLNEIAGLTKILLDSKNLPTEEMALVKKVQDSGAALHSLIEDLLDFSKLDFGKVKLIQLTQTPFNLDRKIQKCFSLLRHQVINKELKLTCDISNDVPKELAGDERRLSQILINLIGNAIKFTDHGEIKVTVKKIATTEMGVILKFIVSDTGIGISKGNCQKVFEPFFQEDISSTRRHEGAGLGLSICKKLVDLMAGEIGVESSKGRGSQFWFTLKLREGESVDSNQEVASFGLPCESPCERS